MKELILILSYILISSLIATVVKTLLNIQITGSFLSRVLYLAMELTIGAGLLLLAIKLGKFPIF